MSVRRDRRAFHRNRLSEISLLTSMVFGYSSTCPDRSDALWVRAAYLLRRKPASMGIIGGTETLARPAGGGRAVGVDAGIGDRHARRPDRLLQVLSQEQDPHRPHDDHVAE